MVDLKQVLDGINIKVVEWPDSQTAVCEVRWADESTNRLLTVLVPIKVAPADVPNRRERQPASSAELIEARELIEESSAIDYVPDYVHLSAFSEAQKVARAFAALPLLQ
jgi:hypothetical protein